MPDPRTSFEVSPCPNPPFRHARLHPALGPKATYSVVNIARWDSVEDWEATVRQHFVRTESNPNAPLQGPQIGSGPVAAHPSLYRVVHVTHEPATERS